MPGFKARAFEMWSPEMEDAVTPPRRENLGNTGERSTFDLQTLTRLEAKVENGEKDLEELRRQLKETNDSHDGLKKSVEADRIAIAASLGEIKGAIRMLLVVGSVSGALVLIGLAILGLVLRR